MRRLEDAAADATADAADAAEAGGGGARLRTLMVHRLKPPALGAGADAARHAVAVAPRRPAAAAGTGAAGTGARARR